MTHLFPDEAFGALFANLYDRNVARSLLHDFYSRVAEEVAGQMRSGEVLDVGTGPAYLLIHIANVAPNHKLTGVDISDKMLKIARRNLVEANLTQRIVLKKGDVNRLPFEDCSFDLVVSTGVLFASKEPVKVLNEFHRVLRPSREGWVYDFCRDIPESQMAGLERDLQKRGMGWSTRWLTTQAIKTAYTIEEFSAVVERSNFEHYEVDRVELPGLGAGMRARLRRNDPVKTRCSQDSRLWERYARFFYHLANSQYRTKSNGSQQHGIIRSSLRTLFQLRFFASP